jgi:tetratricopeptide (TPR) repeat protein
MKKVKYILSVIAIFYTVSMYSAIDNLFNKFIIPDSLKNSFIQSKNQEDKIRALNDIGFYLSGNNPVNSITISNLALVMADSIKYEDGIFDATNNIGIAYYRSSKFKQAIEWFAKAKQIAESMDNDKKLASTYSNMALVYNYLSDYTKALKLNNEALKIRTSLKDSGGIATSYNNIGTTYHYKTEYKTALEYYNKALSIKKILNDKMELQAHIII